MGWAGERKTTDIDKKKKNKTKPTSAPQRSRGSSTSTHGRVKCAQSLSQRHCWQYRSISTNFVHPVSFEPEEGRAWVPHTTTLGFGSEERAVFEIHLHGNSKQTPREACMVEEEGAPGYVWLCNYYFAVCALPWATPTACSPLQQWPQEEGSGSVLPHHALSQARSILPRHLESSVTRFKCFKILHFQSKNKQSQRCVTENALNTGVLLLTVNRT